MIQVKVLVLKNSTLETNEEKECTS